MHFTRSAVVALLAMLVLLTGCGGTLPVGGVPQAPAFPTATAGIELGGASTIGPEVPAQTVVGPTSDVEQAVATTDLPAPPSSTEVAAPPPPPASSPTVNPALANVQLPTAADLQERWRQMQVERTPFEAPAVYVSPGFQVVWWFDPLFGQLVPIGQLRGEFPVQATFRIRGMWITALEIPYHVNQQFGFTIPDPILRRMQNAGVGEWAEVFVYQTQDIQPK